MVDDNDDGIPKETESNLTCGSQIGEEKFAVTYGVENCEGSVAPGQNSPGVLCVTATTEDASLVVSRTLERNR